MVTWRTLPVVEQRITAASVNCGGKYHEAKQAAHKSIFHLCCLVQRKDREAVDTIKPSLKVGSRRTKSCIYYTSRVYPYIYFYTHLSVAYNGIGFASIIIVSLTVIAVAAANSMHTFLHESFFYNTHSFVHFFGAPENSSRFGIFWRFVFRSKSLCFFFFIIISQTECHLNSLVYVV